MPTGARRGIEGALQRTRHRYALGSLVHQFRDRRDSGDEAIPSTRHDQPHVGEPGESLLEAFHRRCRIADRGLVEPVDDDDERAPGAVADGVEERRELGGFCQAVVEVPTPGLSENRLVSAREVTRTKQQDRGACGQGTLRVPRELVALTSPPAAGHDHGASVDRAGLAAE